VADYLANYSNGQGVLHLTIRDAGYDEFRISGSFLKLFDLNPSDVIIMRHDETIPIRLVTEGHDYFTVRCLESKKGLDGTIAGTFCKPSDVLSIIPCNGIPSQLLSFNSQHVGSKMQLMNSSIQSIHTRIIFF
jgi:hypothetical protein